MNLTYIRQIYMKKRKLKINKVKQINEITDSDSKQICRKIRQCFKDGPPWVLSHSPKSFEKWSHQDHESLLWINKGEGVIRPRLRRYFNPHHEWLVSCSLEEWSDLFPSNWMNDGCKKSSFTQYSWQYVFFEIHFSVQPIPRGYLMKWNQHEILRI